MHKEGMLFGVGVGPGNPELLTLKAVKIIEKTRVIAVPKTDEQIIKPLIIVQSVLDLSKKEIIKLPMPMTKEEALFKRNYERAAAQIIGVLVQGENIVFLTLGDPAAFSSYLHIHELVSQLGFKAELITGIPSFLCTCCKA